jgi:NAD(P)-dependent dehydrogenase (short-subunit alcohol dehydrogenase family)
MAVVLVTGCSSGIGLATAIHFARLGHDVHAGVRDPATATDLARAIETQRRSLCAVTLDVDDDASVARAVGETLARTGRIDVLVNNAGIGGGGPIGDVPIEFAEAMFRTNYFGAIRMIRAVLPGMRERRSGAIVNVSSVWGRVAVAGHGHYCAAKHALEAASEALAQEVHAHGIRVAIVEPGAVVTPIFKKARRFAEPTSPYAVHVRRLLLLYQLAMKAPSQPEDVARVIHDAALGPTPRLRHVVGEDARGVIDGRGRLSDEDYAATGRDMSDDEFLALTRRRYGFD